MTCQDPTIRKIVYGRALGSVLKTLILASIVLAFELFTGIHEEVISYIRDMSLSESSLPQPGIQIETKSHLVRRRRNKKAKLYFIMSGNDTNQIEWTPQNLLTRVDECDEPKLSDRCHTTKLFNCDVEMKTRRDIIRKCNLVEETSNVTDSSLKDLFLFDCGIDLNGPCMIYTYSSEI